MTRQPEPASSQSPPGTPKARGDGSIWLITLVLFQFLALKYAISQIPPQPKILGSGADRIRHGDEEEIVVSGLVKNFGGTGAVTLYANLTTDKGKWEQRETVVIPKSSETTFRFSFRGWTGQNATFSTSLAQDHLFEAMQHVAVPPYSKVVLPR